MIDRMLVRKYLGQSLLLWSGCALGLFAFCWVRVWASSLLDMAQFRTILEQFREYERFSPIQFDQLLTYAGRVGMTFDEPIVILCVVIWCVARGSDVVSGELGRGTLEMLLAQPVTRTQLLLSHAAVTAGGLALLVLAAWLGIWVGVQLTTVEETQPPPMFRVPLIGLQIPLSAAPPEVQTVPLSERIDARIYAGSIMNLFAFGFFLLGLSTLMSSWDRYRWRTIGIVVTIYVLQLAMYLLGKAAEPLAWMQPLSFFHLYRPQAIAMRAYDDGWTAAWRLTAEPNAMAFGPFVYSLLLIAMGLACYAAAIWFFRRRDLPAPL